jgi:hypothetical protein
VLSLSSKGLVPGWLVAAMADNKLGPVISSPPVRVAEEATRRALKTVRRLRDFNRHYKKMTAMAS